MEIISRSPTQTINLGARLARLLDKKAIVCLFGELGAGKTVLAKGIAKGLGIESKRIISPSFVLIREYKNKVPLYHFDLYRLKESKAILGLGYEEYFYGDGVSVIEWADRLGVLLPGDFLKIQFQVLGRNTRKIKITAFGKRYTSVLKRLR
jgi:tRNA threonylcarbamoyladenosine biosynthesis protein TsaE